MINYDFVEKLITKTNLFKLINTLTFAVFSFLASVHVLEDILHRFAVDHRAFNMLTVLLFD